MPARGDDPIGWLTATGAQTDVIDGLRPIASDWATLYERCPRGDWLLGILSRLGAPHPSLVRAASACARLALDIAEDDPPIGSAARAVLDCAEAWSRGEAPPSEVAAARAALEEVTSSATDPAIDAAARAALATGMGVDDRDVLAGAPAAAAEAWMMRALDCGLELAMRAAHDKCATAVRNALPWRDVEACLEPGP